VREPLDTETHIKASKLLAYAKRNGLDPVEALHGAGLLLSKGRRRGLKLETMWSIHKQISSWRPAEFLRMKWPAGNRQTTPADMYSCILEYIEKLITAAREET
jgi:hypothetical protein